MAWSSSDGNAFCYVLLMLWIKSLSHYGANGTESNVTLCFVAFSRWRQQEDKV